MFVPFPEPEDEVFVLFVVPPNDDEEPDDNVVKPRPKCSFPSSPSPLPPR